MSPIELFRDTLAGMQTIERAIVEGVSLKVVISVARSPRPLELASRLMVSTELGSSAARKALRFFDAAE